MPFRYEAYPTGFPEFAVPVIESENASQTEHKQALDAAAEDVKRLYEESTSQKLGSAIVYSCHEVRQQFERQIVNPRSVIL